jgi:hypothetical protein
MVDDRKVISRIKEPVPEEVIVLTWVEVSDSDSDLTPCIVTTGAGEKALPVYSDEKKMGAAIRHITSREERRKMNNKGRGLVGVPMPWAKAAKLGLAVGVDYVGLDMYSEGPQVPWRTFYPNDSPGEGVLKAAMSRHRPGPN